MTADSAATTADNAATTADAAAAVTVDFAAGVGERFSAMWRLIVFGTILLAAAGMLNMRTGPVPFVATIACAVTGYALLLASARGVFRWPDTPAKLAVAFLGTIAVIASAGALLVWIVMTHA